MFSSRMDTTTTYRARCHIQDTIAAKEDVHRHLPKMHHANVATQCIFKCALAHFKDSVVAF